MMRSESAFRFWFFRLTKQYSIYNLITGQLETERVHIPTFREVFEELAEEHREVVAADPVWFDSLYYSL